MAEYQYALVVDVCYANTFLLVAMQKLIMTKVKDEDKILESFKLALLRIALAKKFSVYREREEKQREWSKQEEEIKKAYNMIHEGLSKNGKRTEGPEELEKRIKESIEHLENLRKTATKHANISKIDGVINIIKAILEMDSSRKLYEGVLEIAKSRGLDNHELRYLKELERDGRLKYFAKRAGLTESEIKYLIRIEEQKSLFETLAKRLFEEESEYQKNLREGVEKYGKERGYHPEEIKKLLENVNDRVKAFKKLRELADSMHPDQRVFVENFIRRAGIKPERIWYKKGQRKLEDF